MHRQLAALARNALLRPGADDGYADGDDSTWIDVDWPSMTRRERSAGGVNVVDTGGDGDRPAAASSCTASAACGRTGC